MPRVIGGTVRAHREHTLTRIFEAFRKQLYERGYDALTLADVAKAADLARTAMYNYFPDKESLLVGYAKVETEVFVTRLDEALRAVDNPVEQLRIYIRLQLEYFSGNHLPPGPTLRLLVPEAAADQILEHIALLETRLEDIARRGRDRRYFVVDDLPATVAMIAACISRAAPVDAADGGGRDRASLEHAIQATEAFVLRALGASVGDDGVGRRRPRR